MKKAILLTALFVLSLPAILWASDVDLGPEPEWNTLETGHVSLCYIQGADLSRIEKNLRKRATYFSIDIPSEDAPVEERVRYQIDALFRRAEEILEMRPANIHITIKIYATRAKVMELYTKLLNVSKGSLSTESNIKAFYFDKYSTIYISEEDISDSIIIHEMGHAIIDHFFSVIPPEKIRELLASYVDMHLAQ